MEKASVFWNLVHVLEKANGAYGKIKWSVYF